METVSPFRVQKTKHSRLHEQDSQLEFGKLFSDHMFVANYEDAVWQRPRIIPFQDLSLSPSAMALHYGQSIFEGMKAFRMEDGRINIFRPDKHHERINRSLSRMCMPTISQDLFTDALRELVSLDRDWVPSSPDSSLYLRPFVFASEARFGMNVSKEYQFVIFTGPVTPVYQQPLKVKVEREYIRAARGGTGYAKCCGNYGAALYPTQLAKDKGYDQVLWTDATHHEYFEESGITNIMFVVHDMLITPALSDSILDGITRDSILQLARESGIKVEESRISVGDIRHAFKHGTITEAFCVGTGAVVAPISVIGIDEEDFQLPAYHDDSVMFRLKRKLDDIRYGREADVHHWNNVI